MLSRLHTMARFEEPDVNDEPEPITVCESCDEVLCEGEEVVAFEDDYFCDFDCFKLFYDIREILLERG